MASEELAACLTEAQVRGLIGPDELPRATSHARDLGQVAAQPNLPVSCLDLGSGGGLPGLVLAVEWPQSHWVLLDTSRRSTDFLREAVVRLGLGDRVVVVNARAEDAGRLPRHAGAYELVIARSVAQPPAVAEYAAPLLQVGGRLVVSEPPDSTGERWDVEGLAVLGLSPPELVKSPRAVTIAKHGPTPPRFPRKAGMAVKRPLW